jgi:hypothetical protein
MFGKIEGQRLHLAKMHIANYCIALERQAGSLNIYHVVSSINEQFGLVAAHETNALVQDVEYFYNCLTSQQIASIDRGSYWKWKAMSTMDAMAELTKELSALMS